MVIDRSNLEELRARLAEAGLFANKKLGQHFLIDSSVMDDMGHAANLQPTDTVLEIGPGPGVLTQFLLPRVKQVVAIELDPKAAHIIREDFPLVDLVEGDAIQVLPELVQQFDEQPYKVVANIPYQITTPLLRLLLEGEVSPRPTSLTLLIQKEVGMKLAAPAKTSDRGYLSVLAQYFAEVSAVRQVPPTAFWPEPAVNSVVVHLKLHTNPALPHGEERAFLKFVRRHFIQQRKQLRNVLAGIKGVSPAVVGDYFESLGLSQNVRAQELTQEQWLALYHEPLDKQS